MMEPNLKNSINTGDTFSIDNITDILKNKWWLFLSFIILCCGTAYCITKFLTPVYQISAKLLIDDAKRGGSNYDASNIFGDFAGQRNVKSNVDNEVEVLKTRFLAEKVVRNLHLNIIYYEKRTVKNTQIYKAPFIVSLIEVSDSMHNTRFNLVLKGSNTFVLSYKEFKSGNEVSALCRFGNPVYLENIGFQIDINPEIPFEKGLEYNFDINSVNHAVASLQNQLTISVTNKLVTTVDMILMHPIPILGEEILDNLIKCYIEQNKINKDKLVDSTITFIENRLLIVSQELGDIEGNIQNFKQKNKLADLSEQSKIMVTSSNQYENEQSALETQINIIDELQKSLKGNDKNNRSIPTSAITQDLAFTRLVEGYNSLLLERDKLLLTSTENNPYIKNLDERIAAVRNSLLSSLMSIKRTTEISLSQLKKKIALLGDDIKNVPANERTYLGMFRQQSLKQELYLYLLQKREEIALSKTSNLSSSKVIDPPKSGVKPTSPNKIIIFLIGLIFGIIAPIGIIYLQENLNDNIKSKADIYKILALPVIGEIGHVSGKVNYVYKPGQSELLEQFRSLRTNLNFQANGYNKLALLITSSIHAEGKTFTAINLGNILAVSDKKVLLIDLDLRMPNLTNQLKINNQPGFSDYVSSSEPSHEKFIYTSGINDNLFVLPAGTLPSDPSETLMNERAAALINKVKQEYDYVILDSPGVGLVADALLMIKHVSITLYVVRQNRTTKSMLQNFRDIYENNNPGRICFVLNDIKMLSGKAFKYGSYRKS